MQKPHLCAAQEGAENGKKVDMGITIKIDRNFYRYRKESRLRLAILSFATTIVSPVVIPPDRPLVLVPPIFQMTHGAVR